MRQFLVALFILVAVTFVFADVVNSPHNLSPNAATNKAVTAASGTLGNEICVYCHTPHGGSTTIQLWNRNAPTTSYQTYSSTTSDVLASSANVQASVSGACLSCHDGSIALDVVVNFGGQTNTGGATFTTTADAKATYSTTAGFKMAGGLPFLGSDLRNDHPVAITYETARAASTADFATLGSTGSKIYTPTNSLPLYGSSTATATVECATCHNPHKWSTTSGTAGFKFLRISNGASAICVDCHKL